MSFQQGLVPRLPAGRVARRVPVIRDKGTEQRAAAGLRQTPQEGRSHSDERTGADSPDAAERETAGRPGCRAHRRRMFAREAVPHALVP